MAAYGQSHAIHNKLFTYAHDTNHRHSIARVIYKYDIASVQHHHTSNTLHLPVP